MQLTGQEQHSICLAEDEDSSEKCQSNLSGPVEEMCYVQCLRPHSTG